MQDEQDRPVRRSTFRNPWQRGNPQELLTPAALPTSPEIIPFDVCDDDFAAEPNPQVAPIIAASPPHAPLAIAAGYTVYAVQLDDVGEVITGQTVAGPGLRIGSAAAIANAAAFHPERYPFDANYVVVNDSAGETIDKYPVLRVAA